MPQITRISPTLLRPRIAELGKIKIGAKGKLVRSKGGREFRLPAKLDHFRVTRRERDGSDNYVLDTEIHQKIGQTPKTLNFFCLFDEPADNFQYFLAAYDGTRERCRGNGEFAVDREQGRIPCTCPLLRQHVGDYAGPSRPAGISCKPHGRLSVILEAASTYGGYHVLRTTSWETISSIAGTLEHLRNEFGGLRGLPLQLVVYPATDRFEENGQQKTSTSYKVAVVLRATYREAYQIAGAAREWRSQNLLPPSEAEQVARRHREQMEEEEARQASDIAQEFHPETIAGAPVGDGIAVDADDYEIVEDDDDDERIALARRALEIAEISQEKINRALLDFEDRPDELLADIEKNRPDALNRAREEARLAAEAAAMQRPPDADEGDGEATDDSATSPAAQSTDPLDLFGE